MKIFKTILWTSLFWLLVIAGLWIASLFFPQEASIVIPAKVKNVIIENVGHEFCINDWEEINIDETNITDEEIAPEEEIIAEDSTVEEIVAPAEESVVEEVIAEPVKNSILPQPTQATTATDDEIAELESRLNEVEAKYDALVEELRTIFATPLFTQLLSQAFAENPTVETTNL